MADFKDMAELDAAVRDYFEKAHPHSMLNGWVILFDRTNMTEGENYVSREVGPGTSWVQVRGMIDIAHTSEQAAQRKPH